MKIHPLLLLVIGGALSFALINPASPEAARRPFLSAPLPAARIIVDKQARELYLYSGESLVRTYPVKLGLNPVDDKERQGDRRTPEGFFYVCLKNPHSRFHLSLGLSYPNLEDAERGLKNKLITQAQYDTIARKIAQGHIPPWDTALGGEIFIHGKAEAWDWTYGCVALTDRDIEELFRVVPVGTRVEIRKDSRLVQAANGPPP